MRRRIARWIGFAMLSTISLSLLIAGVSRLRAPHRTPFNGSAHDTGTGGGKAFQLWAEKMGWPVAILGEPLPLAPTVLDGVGNCLFSTGNERLSHSSESDAGATASWNAFREWVERGNTLFLVTSEPDTLPEELFKYVLQSPTPTIVSPPTPSNESESWTTGTITILDHPLAVNALGPRWTHVPNSWETAGDHRGNVYHRIQVGQGAVVILLDDLSFSNQGLDFASNPEAIEALVQRELHGGRIAMDEARHGHGQVRSYLTSLLGLPVAKTFLGLSLLLIVFALYGQNIRLGRPERFEERERRSAREYVDALADLHERARAAPLIVEAAANRLQSIARRRANLSPDIANVLKRAAEYRTAAPRDTMPLDALRLVREIIQLRRASFGSQRTTK